MDSQKFRYDLMVEKALRNVVREALQEVAINGLFGEHHFYITFSTKNSGVEIADWLRSQYPEEMTIILQYQFWNLIIEEDYFSIMLSFDNRQEKLVIPFSSIIAFADPAVKFGLQFETVMNQVSLAKDSEDNETNHEQNKSADVVTLDSFRKK
ncbi:MAG: hypothetical protein K1X44_08600 [Alphaproteobacteria bacterium]|nr:hypothetical protein [Alphaproteobacteria bacterium]